MKKYILILLLTTISLTSCGKEEVSEQKYYSTWIVQTWSINLDNSYVWYVESEDTVNLSAKMWWKITNIYKEEWDRVNAWELVAILDWSEAKVWYSTASNIASTLETMKDQTSNMFDSQIKVMEAKIEQVKAWNTGIDLWLQDTKSITEAQLKTASSRVEQAKLWVETAKTNLDQTKIVLSTTEEHIYKNTLSAITNSVILDTNILNFVDTLIWVTKENKDKNNSFEDYLWAKDITSLKDAKKEFLEVNELFREYKDLYEQKIENKTPDNDSIKDIANKWIDIAEKLKVLLSSTYDVLDNSIDNIQLTQSTIDSYKSQVSEMWQDIESSLLTVSWDYILWLKGSIENMESFKSESEMQLSLLEKQYELAEKWLDTANNTYDQYKKMSKWQINEITTKKNVTENQLKEALAWLEALKKQKQTSLSEIDAKIWEVYGQKNSASVMIWNSEVISPISWVVINKLNEIWQVVWWAMPILVIADESKLQIKVWVDDNAISSIKVWDNVKIDIDWVQWQVNWKIKNIYPSKDNITKKNIVEISIGLSKILGLENQVKIWSMAKIYFENIKEKSSIIIPNEAITQKFMLAWVYTLHDWKVIFKNIEILEQNDSIAKVSWLKVWETIILDWKENIYDWEILNN